MKTIRPVALSHKLRAWEKSCLLSENFGKADAFRQAADEIDRLYMVIKDLQKAIRDVKI